MYWLDLDLASMIPKLKAYAKADNATAETAANLIEQIGQDQSKAKDWVEKGMPQIRQDLEA